MGQIVCKGTIVKLKIATVLTAVAQMSDCTPPSWKSLDYESKAYDSSAGVPRDLNGWVDGGEFDATFWWDPTLATHAAMLALVTPTPAKGTWEVLLTSGTPNKIDFTTAGLEVSPKLDMDKAAQCEVKGNLDGVAVMS